MNRYAIFIVLSCAMIVMICGSASAATPSANFTANTTNGHSPLNVHFTDKSTGNPTSWNWDFGDGSSSTDQNPNHTFSTVGAYTIKLTAANDDGSSSLTRTNYITAWNTTSVMSSNNGIAFYVANDAGVKYDIANGVNQQGDYQQIHVNNSYYISRGGGGMNPIQISTDPTIKSGTITTTGNQTGKFWVVFSGGIGHMDDCILMLAVNGTIPDNFAFHVSASGYTYDLPAPALSNPVTSTLTNVQFVNGVNETFTKSDFIYGPQSWKPTNSVNYPIYNGQDPNNNFSLMFIDLDVGAFGTNAYPGVTNGSIEVDYSFSNLESFASFGAYGWFDACNWGTGIPMASNIAQGGYSVQGITPVTPVANFTANTTTGLNPATVQFTDTSSNTPNSWLWDFGDGTTSTDQNPVHVYNTPGTYTVTLIATNNAGSSSLTQTGYIQVFNSQNPSVTANPKEEYYNKTINVSLTSDQPDAVIYYTTDGSDPTDSSNKSRVPYSDPIPISNNTVLNFAAVNNGGVWSSRYSKNYVIDTSIPEVYVNPGEGNYVDSVNVELTGKDPDTLTTVYYTTDGSDPKSSTTANVYTGPLTLLSTTTLRYVAVDQASNWSPEYVQTYTIINAPVANFTANSTKGTAPLNVQFTDKSNNSPTSWLWDFGDGTTSIDQNPIHNYSTPGTYTVTLKVTNLAGDSNLILTNYVTVDWPVPVANFTVNVNNGTAPLNVQFTNKSTGNVANYNWDFGDGSTSTTPSPTHTYNTPGTYSVTLTVTGPGGSSTETFINYVTVNPPAPIANFTVNATSGTAPLDVQFTDKSIGNVKSYSWNFGDGSTSTEKNTEHVYSVPGTYTVILIVNGPGGMTSQTKYITVNYPAPIAGFTANTTKGAAPLKIKFTDSSTGNVSGYLWNFGDGITSTDQNPTHSYTKPGSYTVKLTVTNHGGSSSVSSLMTVQNHILPTATTNVKGGLYNTEKTVTIAMSKSGSIYYTINGSTPTTSSKKYAGPISIKSTTNLKFIVVDNDGYKSNVYTETYTIDKIPPKASANVQSGLYNADKSVKLTMDKKGTIYYTINGTTPTTSSKKYTGPISIKSTTNLKFIAVDLAGNKSPVYTNKYTIDKKSPMVTSSNPVNGAKNVSTTSTITINFNKLLKSSLNWSKIYIKNLSTGKLVSIKTTIKNNHLNIKMILTRYSKNNYQVYVPQSAIRDNAGNNLTKAYYFSFKTK